ncbi:hypothetical protein MYP_3640 [Sporocytophaga myxococcoides]|uniref:Secretion system C-terminal sorting domain-containing protein n=1 Tax=Sporocytophaga myxococcoides TaxID=153721 RepID=A0A098LHG0_9BACT|nr:T9SS type A sorting domain-containing protein [Sporocytophaga myxococcoides]GAL86411.1 hypothetical protein MYP_3640 [Sporocytophaga myxococcoides]
MKRIFPNPVNDVLFLQFNKSTDAISEIKITNALQKDVYDRKDIESQTSLDLSGLSAGIYFVHVTTDKGIDYFQKILILK